jgi:hypothetical protein
LGVRGSSGLTYRRRHCWLPCTYHTQSPQRPLLITGSRHLPEVARYWATATPASLGGALTGWSHIPRFFDCVAGPAPRGDAESAPLLSAGPGAR